MVGSDEKTILKLKERLRTDFRYTIEGKEYLEKTVKELIETLFPNLFADKFYEFSQNVYEIFIFSVCIFMLYLSSRV